MSFPQYPEYKDSGVEWLGEVPAHWEVPKLKHLVRIRNGRDYKAVEVDSGGYPVIGSGGEFSRADSYLYKGKSVLLGRKGTIDKPLYIDGPFWTVDTMFYTELSHDVNGRFLFHYATCFRFDQYSTNTALPSMAQEDLANIQLAVPEIDEQASIAAFLDHETARIDALIDEQKHLIALLKEKRQAVISHAVTKGLDPDVPMKDSGVEWLGEVPAHWMLKRIKHVVRVFEQGWSPQCENTPIESKSEWGVLKVGCVNHGRFECQENKKLPTNLPPRPDLAIEAYDVLISRANTRELVGSCAVPTIDHPNLMLSDKLFRLRLHKSVADPLFLAFFMGTTQTRRRIELEATGASSSMLNIGQSTVLEMPLLCPPVEEQVKIRDEIIRQTENLLNMAGEAIKLEERLKERRSALISAAVTGKIDVRNWQPEQTAEQPGLSMVAETHATYS